MQGEAWAAPARLGADPEEPMRSASALVCAALLAGCVSVQPKTLTLFPDPAAAATQAAQLRKAGQAERAAALALAARTEHPDHAGLALEAGLSLLAAGRGEQAAPMLRDAAQRDPSTRVALALALDQSGRHLEAQEVYREALAAKPGDPLALTNLGASLLLTGDAEAAEIALREAVAAPDAPAHARQNLALALAFQGRFGEAETIARADLPPDAAAANIAYVRALLGEGGRRWSELKR